MAVDTVREANPEISEDGTVEGPASSARPRELSSSTRSAGLSSLLSTQECVFKRRFGEYVASSLAQVPDAFEDENVSSYLSLRAEAKGYALVSATPLTDVLSCLWVENDNVALARTFVRAAQLAARRRGRRLEAQDLGFGDGNLSPMLRDVSLESWPRLYLRADLGGRPNAVAPERVTLRTFKDGDLLSAANLSTRAFASTSDASFSASHRTNAGALERLGLAIQGRAWGPFENTLSPVAVDASGKMQGFALVTRFDTRVAHLGEIAVSTKSSRQGIGSLLLKRTLELSARAGLEELTLCVSADNAAALGLYRKHGFRRARAFDAHILATGKNVDPSGQILPSEDDLSEKAPLSHGV